MEFNSGDLVRIGDGGVSVFRVVEIGVDGDPGMVLIEAVGEPRPGIYPWPIRMAHLVPATDQSTGPETAD
ncbi:hypothetical protein ACFYT3_20375 [Nocardia amikacinitolerans]|uniref:hypothetical protein n=1 Tax=Nocardia amikacinitolerans TaxID=756689 RepID=UPI0036C40E2A